MLGLPSWTFKTSSTSIPKLNKYLAVPLVATNLKPKTISSLAMYSNLSLSKSLVDKKATPSEGTPFPAAAGNGVPSEGVAFLSTNDLDKDKLEYIARELIVLGFKLVATKGTAKYLFNLGIEVDEVLKVHEGRPNIEDSIRSGLIQLVINTPVGSQALHDDAYLRRASLEYNIPTFTTIPGAKAALQAIKSLRLNKIDTLSLQDIHNY